VLSPCETPSDNELSEPKGRQLQSFDTPNCVAKTEHRNATNLEIAKTLCLLVFSSLRDPEYRALFLNRVSQVRILPRALGLHGPLPRAAGHARIAQLRFEKAVDLPDPVSEI
jgi:hypothetical protein